jgi:hypothetical protein
MARKSDASAVPMDDYQAQSDADTLMRAEEIRGDKKRHEAARHHVKKRFHAAARAMTGGKAKGARYRAENVVSRKDMI